MESYIDYMNEENKIQTNGWHAPDVPEVTYDEWVEKNGNSAHFQTSIMKLDSFLLRSEYNYTQRILVACDCVRCTNTRFPIVNYGEEVVSRQLHVADDHYSDYRAICDYWRNEVLQCRPAWMRTATDIVGDECGIFAHVRDILELTNVWETISKRQFVIPEQVKHLLDFGSCRNVDSAAEPCFTVIADNVVTVFAPKRIFSMVLCKNISEGIYGGSMVGNTLFIHTTSIFERELAFGVDQIYMCVPARKIVLSKNDSVIPVKNGPVSFKFVDDADSFSYVDAGYAGYWNYDSTFQTKNIIALHGGRCNYNFPQFVFQDKFNMAGTEYDATQLITKFISRRRFF